MDLRPIPTLNAIPAARTALADLRRPRLLIRAARHALSDYQRHRGLARILGELSTETTDPLPALLDREAELDHARRHGDAAYSVSRHIEILVALMAEARAQSAEA